MHWMELFGYLGALLTLATFSMKTMLNLRIAGITANVAFIAYGLLQSVTPVLLLHLALLPLNVWRLWQLRRLVSEISDAASGRLAVEWLLPFTHRRQGEAGELLFRRGDVARELLFVLDGEFRAQEADVALRRGDVFGELGLVMADHRRTQTVVCETAGTLLSLSYDEVRMLFFQNPKFGYYFLQLVAERLARDARRAEALPTDAPDPMAAMAA